VVSGVEYYYKIIAVDSSLNRSAQSTVIGPFKAGVHVNGVESNGSSLPTEFVLAQNYPNPFNPSTVINYQLPMTNHVTLKVYDAIGREVATLVNEVKEAGTYSATFDGSKLSSGIYFYTLKAENFTAVKKLLLMK